MTKGRHSIRAGGELRRHHLDGDLREGQNRRHNFRSWFDFLTVGYRNPSDGNRARQISDTAITYGETARNYRMTDVNAFIAEDWKLSSNLTLNLGVRWEYFGFPSEKNGLLAVFDYPGRARNRHGAGRVRLRVELRSELGSRRRRADLTNGGQQDHHPRRLRQRHAARRVRLDARPRNGTSFCAAATACSTSGPPAVSPTRCARRRRSSANCS